VVVTALLFIKTALPYGIFSLMFFFATFIYLIIRYNKLSHELKRLRCMSDINRMYLDRMNSEWISFIDCGQDFVNSQHFYTSDLDIFGSKSLFQWLCVANTYYGRQALKELIEKPDKRIEALIKRQEAVKELSGKLDFCQKLQSEGILAKNVSKDPESFLSYAEEQSAQFKKERMHCFLFLLPISVILSFVLFFAGIPISIFIPLLLLAFQMTIFAAGFKGNSIITSKVYDLKNHMEAFESLLQIIEQEEFSGGKLNALRQDLLRNNKPASFSLKKLENVANAIDVKFSTVLYFLLNFVLLWDYHCVFALKKWKRQYGGEIRKWLKVVGKFEAIASLAVIGQLYPECSYPEFTLKEIKFSAIAMGHPLIQKDRCVCNDFEINGGACVITGSNMSGKTTLLRTVGINLVLAYSGAPVFAQKLECSVMDIFTSMRVSDELNSGISTFYAELLRIKNIILYSQKEQPMIYLIDEIFKGTNSLDRIAGARSVLKNLARGWIIGLISTHDFELCDLEKETQAKIKNYHFTEYYENNEIRFDYKIRPGMCETTNARFLMKMVGIELYD